jgi:tetratricopeptide (TPR) repeat protein
VAQPMRTYRAFISYSHADAKQARQILRKLATYRLPSGLRHGGSGKLGAFFMDREALPAASDLSQEIVTALTQSQALVVICSPEAGRSTWVAKEISTFKALHPEGRILAAIVSNGSAAASDPFSCFPQPLLEDGEPLAADFRESGDGPHLACLKLVAGLTQIPLMDLSRRDARRRTQRVMGVTAGASLIALIMSGLAIAAVSASQLAQRKQAEAEDMVDFMLGDLRNRLEPVGRLDALAGVADKTLDYYADQDENKLDCDAAGRKARALQLAARVAIDTGDRQASSGHVDASKRLTDRLLETCVDDPDTLFNAAQAEYWAGEFLRRQWRSSKGAADAPELDLVRDHWTSYFELSNRLRDIDPDNPDYVLELAFARSNLGTINLNSGKPDTALEWFRLAEEDFRKIAESRPDDVELQLEYADTVSWTSTTLMQLKRYGASLKKRDLHKSLLERIDQSARNTDWHVRRNIVTAHLRTIETLIAMRDAESAQRSVHAVRPLITELRLHDPNNSDWKDAEAFLSNHEQSLITLTQRPD